MISEFEILFIIKQALLRIYSKDIYLIENNASERSIVFKFAHYFLQLSKVFLPDYDVDIEYNRHKTDTKIDSKRLPDFKYPIFPDFIVHKRDETDNLVIIEFKTQWYKNTENDEKKIQDFCTEKDYNYQYGYSIILEKDFENIKMKKYNKEQNIFEKINMA